MKLESEIDQRFNLVEKVEIHAGKSMVVVKAAPFPSAASVVDPNTGLPSVAGNGGAINRSTGLPVTAREVCIANLRQIDSAKHMWAIEQHKQSDDIPTESDLLPYIGPPGHSFPHCPLQGTYAINAAGELPTCSVPGHTLSNEPNANPPDKINPATGLPDSNNGTDASASAETWSPTLAPEGKMDLQNILNSAQSLTDEGSYEDALQRFLWYFEHSRSDAGQRGVRLSFALSDWVELGRRYPKAKQALIEIRDADTRQFSEGGYADLFQEVSGINKYLSQEDATLALFNTIEHRDPALARQCYPSVQGLLVQKGEYEKCVGYIGDPHGAFERIRDSRERMKSWEDQQADRRDQMQKQYQAIAKTNSAFLIPPALPVPPKFADNNFVGQTRQLIEILVGAGHEPDAEEIRDQAVGVLDDTRLRSAISDAQDKMSWPKFPVMPATIKLIPF